MIIVTGAAGQLGRDVVLELEKRKIKHIGIDIGQLDITDSEAVNRFFRNLAGGGASAICVIHCAAYTTVDKAEDEPELCFKVNAEGTENLAKACRDIDAEMIYVSTDYVFDGSGSQLRETDAVKNPLSVYGKSKLAGEEAVINHLSKHYIVRTSWAFGKSGSNFVRTMLILAQTNTEVYVVDDQIGSPTYTPDLAVLLCDMALSGKYGVYHATNEGFCSWAQFAEEIMILFEATGGKRAKIVPVASTEFHTKAKRPMNSRLSKKCLDDAGFSRLPPWQDALARYMEINRGYHKNG